MNEQSNDRRKNRIDRSARQQAASWCAAGDRGTHLALPVAPAEPHTGTGSAFLPSLPSMPSVALAVLVGGVSGLLWTLFDTSAYFSSTEPEPSAVQAQSAPWGLRELGAVGTTLSVVFFASITLFSLGVLLSPTMASWARGGLDVLYSTTRISWLRPAGERLFSGGFGKDIVPALTAFRTNLGDIAEGRSSLKAPVADLRILPPKASSSTRSASRVPAFVQRLLPWTQWDSAAAPTTPPSAALRSVEVEFPSPLMDHLPEVSQVARALVLLGPGLPELKSEDVVAGASLAALVRATNPKEVVVHMPAFGEERYGSRAKVAHVIAKKRPESLHFILMAPFYGDRRPAQQHKHFVPTVSGKLRQSFAISSEAAGILQWASTQFREAHLLVTGFSFGAAMASTAACLTAPLLERLDSRDPLAPALLGVVPCVGSATPAVIADGVLESDVDWPRIEEEWRTLQGDEALFRVVVALNEGDEEEARHLRDARTAKEFLHRLLGVVHTEKLVRALEARALRWKEAPRRGFAFDAVVALGARHDHFVKFPYSTDLFRALARVAPPERASFVALDGGHVTSFVNRTAIFVPAVVRALEELDAVARFPKRTSP